jgi:hypothetical protein
MRRASALRQFLEAFERPALLRTPGKWMDHRGAAADGIARDARNAVARAGRDGAHLLQIEIRRMRTASFGRQRREELERQAQRGDGLPELGPIGAIPGDDRIEPAQGFEQPRVWAGQLEQIEAGGSDGPGMLCANAPPAAHSAAPPKLPDIRRAGTPWPEWRR